MNYIKVACVLRKAGRILDIVSRVLVFIMIVLLVALVVSCSVFNPPVNTAPPPGLTGEWIMTFDSIGMTGTQTIESHFLIVNDIVVCSNLFPCGLAKITIPNYANSNRDMVEVTLGNMKQVDGKYQIESILFAFSGILEDGVMKGSIIGDDNIEYSCTIKRSASVASGILRDLISWLFTKIKGFIL